MFKNRAMFSEERHHLENFVASERLCQSYASHSHHHHHQTSSCSLVFTNLTDNCVFPPSNHHLNSCSLQNSDLSLVDTLASGGLNISANHNTNVLVPSNTPLSVDDWNSNNQDFSSACGSESENSEESQSLGSSDIKGNYISVNKEMRSHPNQENLNQRKYRKKRGLYHQLQQRQAANLRERRRMQSINDAFEVRWV